MASQWKKIQSYTLLPAQEQMVMQLDSIQQISHRKQTSIHQGDVEVKTGLFTGTKVPTIERCQEAHFCNCKMQTLQPNAYISILAFPKFFCMFISVLTQRTRKQQGSSIISLMGFYSVGSSGRY